VSDRTQLQRLLSPSHITALAIGTIIGFGCFVLPGEFLIKAGPLGAVIGIALGALMMIVVAASYGVMVQKMPVAGGEFVFAYFAAGRYQAYVCGWFLVLGYISIVPLNATALAVLGKFVLPGLFAKGYLYSVAGFDVYVGEIVLASSATIIFGYLNYRGVKSVGFSQLLMVWLLGGSVLLIAVGVGINPQSTLDHLEPLFAPNRSAMAGIFAMLAIAPWLYVGFDTLTEASEEFAFSPAQTFRLMTIAIILGGLMYTALIVATAIVEPWPALVAAHPSWPTGYAVERTLGTPGVVFLTTAICMGIFTSINGFFLATSRLLFSMSRSRVLPPWFGELRPGHGTPGNAVIFTAAVSLLAPWFGRQVISWIVDMAAVGTAFGYFYTCLAAVRVLRAESTPRPVMVAVALFGIVCSAGFMVLLCVPGMPAFMAVPSWVALAAWVVLGILFFAVRAREYRALDGRELDRLMFGGYAPRTHPPTSPSQTADVPRTA
jgi:amino acid transporter